MENKFGRIIRLLWRFLEEYISIVAAAITIALSTFNLIEDRIVSLVLVGILGFVTLELIKAKREIEDINHTTQNVIDSLQMTRMNQSYDEIFYGEETTDQQSKEPREIQIVEEAQQNLLIIQETGNRFIEKNSKAISECLSKGITVDIVICSTSQITQSLLMLRNANLDNPQNFEDRYKVFIARLLTCLRDEIGDIDEKKIKNISLRYCPYPIDITSVMSDPNNPISGHCVVRFAGFRVTYEKKLDIEIYKKHSKRVFDYYYDQILQYQLISYKKILLTGAPKTGKTTLFKKILESVSYKTSNGIFWILSREIIKNKERCGFEVTYKGHSEPILFASVNPEIEDIQTGIDKYDLTNNEKVWDVIADEIISAKERIFIIDEIGLMQAKSSKFIEAVTRLMKNPEITVFATITEDYYSVPGLKEIGSDISAVDYILTAENRDELQNQLTKELKGSLQLEKFENYIHKE